jgi:hypothetical protein
MSIEPCGVADISVDSGWSYKPSKNAPIGIYNVYAQSALDEAIKQAKQEQRDEDNRIVKECFKLSIEQMADEIRSKS